MAAVGFDLYTRMLAEAVEEEKAALEHAAGRRRGRRRVIDLPGRRLPARRLRARGAPEAGAVPAAGSGRRPPGELAAVRAELLDRFGPLPAPVERLLEVARLRITAEAAGLASLAREDGQLVLRFGPDWSRADDDARAGADVAGRPRAGRRWPAA